MQRLWTEPNYKAQDQVETGFSLATVLIQVCIHIDNIYLRSEGIYYLWYTSLHGLVGQYGNGYTLLYLTKTPTQVSCTFIVWTSDMPELRSTVNSAKQMQHSFLIVHMQLSHNLSSSPLLASFPCRLSSQKKVTLFLKCQESLGTGLSHQSTTHTQTSLRM